MIAHSKATRTTSTASPSFPTATLITAGQDKTLRVWDIAAKKELFQIKMPYEAQSLAVLPGTMKTLVGGEKSGDIVVYDLDAKKETAPVDRAQEHRLDASHLPGRHETSQRRRRPQRPPWDIASGKELKKLDGHAGYVHDVHSSQDGKHAVSVGYNHVNRVWNLETGQTLVAYEAHGRTALSTAASRRTAN